MLLTCPTLEYCIGPDTSCCSDSGSPTDEPSEEQSDEPSAAATPTEQDTPSQTTDSSFSVPSTWECESGDSKEQCCKRGDPSYVWCSGEYVPKCYDPTSQECCSDGSACEGQGCCSEQGVSAITPDPAEATAESSDSPSQTRNIFVSRTRWPDDVGLANSHHRTGPPLPRPLGTRTMAIPWATVTSRTPPPLSAVARSPPLLLVSLAWLCYNGSVRPSMHLFLCLNCGQSDATDVEVLGSLSFTHRNNFLAFAKRIHECAVITPMDLYEIAEEAFASQRYQQKTNQIVISTRPSRTCTTETIEWLLRA